MLCKKIDSTKEAKNITDYKSIILSKYPGIPNVPVYIDRCKRVIYPLSALDEEKTPDWWSAHQGVKHHRHENFSQATLINTLNALSALLIFELYLYGEQGERKGGTALLRAPGMSIFIRGRAEEELDELFGKKK